MQNRMRRHSIISKRNSKPDRLPITRINSRMPLVAHIRRICSQDQSIRTASYGCGVVGRGKGDLGFAACEVYPSAETPLC